jgi:nitrate reductase NapE component
VDPSALIFVALAVAWAAYLVPMAVRRHEDAATSRSVDRFSHTLRVLARREPVDTRSARLVTPGRPAAEAAPVEKRAETKVAAPAPAPAPVQLTPAQLRAKRAAAKRATKRRRNVLALILVATLAVVAVAAFGVIFWWYVAIPVGLLVAWLVACRVMVKGERKALTPAARMPIEVPAERPNKEEPVEAPAGRILTDDGDDAEVDPLADTSAGMAAIVDPALWDPVPVTLPTYVNKPAAARRTVRTIALDDTGVWTSGRTDADAQLAREADEAERAARQARTDGDEHRAVGS